MQKCRSDSYGFTFNEHHSSEYGLKILSTKTLTFPAKNKVTVQVPYSSGLLDLSSIYGGATYGERTVTFVCRLPIGDVQYVDADAQVTAIMRWLMGTSGKSKLIDDVEPDCYYMGEVQEAPTVTDGSIFTDISVTFTCYPYRFHVLNRNDLWDWANWELDVEQDLDFEVTGEAQTVLVNIGINQVTLKIVSDSAFILLINDEQYQINAGTTDEDELQLPVGENMIYMYGKGRIAFYWEDEVI